MVLLEFSCDYLILQIESHWLAKLFKSARTHIRYWGDSGTVFISWRNRDINLNCYFRNILFPSWSFLSYRKHEWTLNSIPTCSFPKKKNSVLYGISFRNQRIRLLFLDWQVVGLKLDIAFTSANSFSNCFCFSDKL